MQPKLKQLYAFSSFAYRQVLLIARKKHKAYYPDFNIIMLKLFNVSISLFAKNKN